MQPGECGPYEPLAGAVFGFVRAIGQPESRFDAATQASSLRSLGTDERMEILVSDETTEIEKSGVGPIRGYEKIRRTRARFQTRGQESAGGVRQICSACRNFGSECDGCLRSAPLGVAAIEAVFDEDHDVAETGSADRRHTGTREMIGDKRNENR